MTVADFPDTVAVPYEFDQATTLYGDIRSMIAHHDRSKSQCSPYLRALYDLRSGVILQMVWAISKMMESYVASMGMSVESYAGLRLLRASLGRLNPVRDALRYLDSALNEYPTLGEAFYHKGLIFAALGQHDEAISAYQSATGLLRSIIPNRHDVVFDSRVLFDCGRSLEERERLAEASGCYERAIELESNFPEAQRRYAACLQRAGKCGLAAIHFDRAMACRPVLLTLPKLPTHMVAARTRRSFHLPQFSDSLIDGPPRDLVYIEGYLGFDIFRSSGALHAITQGESGFRLQRARAGKYTHWLSNDSLDKLRSEIGLLSVLIEQDYRGFNIILASGAYHAILQSEGVFDLSRAQAGQYFCWITSHSLGIVRADINALLDSVSLVEEAFHGCNLLQVGRNFYAIRQDSGEFSIGRLAQNGGYDILYAAPSVPELKEKIESIKLVEEGYRGFNIVLAYAAYHAILQSEGVFDLSRAQAGQYFCWITSHSLGIVRADINALLDSVSLVEEAFHGCNLLQVGRNFYAIRQDSGEFSIGRLAQNGGYDILYAAPSVPELKEKIESIKLVEEGYRGFNIVLAYAAYHAILQSEGVFDLSRAQAGQYFCWITSHSLGIVRADINALLDSVSLVEEAFHGCNLLQVGRNFYAIRQDSGEFSIGRLAQNGGYDILYAAPSVPELKEKIESIKLVEEGYRGFNIVLAYAAYHAILQSEGVFDLSRAQAGQYFCWITSHSLGIVRADINALLDSVSLVEEAFHGCNLLQVGRNFYAIRQDSGEFSIGRLAQNGGYDILYAAPSVPELKEKIESIKLVEEGYRGFNIVLAYAAYHAILQSEGVFDLSRAQAGVLSFSSNSLSAVRSKIDALLNTITLAEQGVSGYNILRVGKDFYAIGQDQGEFSLDRLTRGDYGKLKTATSLLELKKKIRPRQRLLSKYWTRRLARRVISAVSRQIPSSIKRLIRPLVSPFRRNN